MFGRKHSPLIFYIFSLSLYFFSSQAIESEQRPIYVRLKSDISSARGRSQSNPQAIAQLEKIASLSPVIKASARSGSSAAALSAHRLDRYYEVSPDQLVGKNHDDIVAALLNNPLVESAQVEPVAFPAGFLGFNQSQYKSRSSIPDYTNCEGTSFATCQKYMLEPEGRQGWKMGGLNAFQAQQIANNLGENVRIIVVEVDHPDWDHIDLKQPFLTISQLVIDYHSTASAGIMIGQANGVGVTGFAPKAEVGYAKWSPERLVELSGHLQAGDVIQIGIQYGMGTHFPYCVNNQCYVPVEALDLVQDTISYLTKELGVHVIMAAANGDVDLDHPAHKGRYSRARDTGGIYAGACNAKAGIRSYFSDYGSRVDLFSWGDSVTTTSWEPGMKNQYRTGFGGTSAANPILAGATAFIQSVARARGIGNIDPFVMRQLLVDSGRPLPNADSKNIGKQPDLVKALQLLDRFSGNPISTTRPPPGTTRTPPGTTTTINQGGGGSCQGVQEWKSGTIYNTPATKVQFSGKMYQSNHWTQGQQPDRFNGQGQPWQFVEICGSATTTSTTTTAKTRTTTSTTTMTKTRPTTTTTTTTTTATTTTRSPFPGNSQCDGVAEWSASRVYDVKGELTQYNNKKYQQMHWNRNQRPDQFNGECGEPWKFVSDCSSSNAKSVNPHQ